MSKRNDSRDAVKLWDAAESICKIVESRSEAFISAREERIGGIPTALLCPDMLAATPDELVSLHKTAADLYDAAAALWAEAGCEDYASEARGKGAGIRGYYYLNDFRG